jgi:hypothetical protein
MGVSRFHVPSFDMVPDSSVRNRSGEIGEEIPAGSIQQKNHNATTTN